jgi:hypothetical protein
MSATSGAYMVRPSATRIMPRKGQMLRMIRAIGMLPIAQPAKTRPPMAFIIAMPEEEARASRASLQS